jgi:hypothetical protein
MMGGQIWVTSQVGQGSTFHFRLWLEKVSAKDAYRCLAAPAGDLKNKRVLIVEDNETNRRILSEMLAFWNISHEAVPYL